MMNLNTVKPTNSKNHYKWLSKILSPSLLFKGGYGVFILLLLQAPLAFAASSCTISPPTSIAFGSQSSAAAATALQAYNATAIGITCNFSIITLLSTSRFSATLNNLGTLSMTNSSGTYSIPYTAYANATGNTYSTPFTVGTPVTYGSGGVLGLGLITLGGQQASAPVYLQLNGGANVPAGNYTGTLNFTWDYSLCDFISALNFCIGTVVTGSGTAIVNVSMTVTNTCSVTAPNIAFGTNALVEQFVPVTQSVAVQCTLNAPYQVTFGQGNHYATPWRRMINGTSNFIQYNFYLPNTTTTWDSSTVTGTGTGAGQTAQNISYTASINPATPTTEPAAGAYTDTVSVIITY